MSASVMFSAEKLIKRLNQIEKLLVPQATKQAFKSINFENRNSHFDAIKETYQHATTHTLRSQRFNHQCLKQIIGINDDQK